MIAIARWAMASRTRAILVAFVTALFSPLLFWFSAAFAGLVTLRAGIGQGTQVLGIVVLGGILSLMVYGDPTLIMIAPIVVLLAAILRATISWDLTLTAGAGLGLVLVALTQVFAQDALAAMLEAMKQELMPVLESIAADAQLDSNGIGLAHTLFEGLKQNISSFLAVGVYQLAILFVLMARWMQAGVYNPGGFRQEFHSLRISQRSSMILVVAAVLTWWWSGVALVVVLMPHTFAGLALIHSVIAKKDLGGLWLFVLYAALFLVGQFLFPLVLLLALVDSFFDLRRFIKTAHQ